MSEKVETEEEESKARLAQVEKTSKSPTQPPNKDWTDALKAVGKEEMKNTLIRQIEFILSKDQLLQNPYLLSQLTDKLYLPIEAVYHDQRIQAKTTDINLFYKVRYIYIYIYICRHWLKFHILM